MSVENLESVLEIRFTEAHLVRVMGEALHNAYQGKLDYQYTDEDSMLRVTWTR